MFIIQVTAKEETVVYKYSRHVFRFFLLKIDMVVTASFKIFCDR